MHGEKEEYSISIQDKDLFEQLKSFSEARELSPGDVTEEALRKYFSGRGGEDQSSSDDDVFNPDPGA